MDDETFRTIAIVVGIVVVGVFKEPILKFLKKIGYTGWK